MDGDFDVRVVTRESRRLLLVERGRVRSFGINLESILLLQVAAIWRALVRNRGLIVSRVDNVLGAVLRRHVAVVDVLVGVLVRGEQDRVRIVSKTVLVSRRSRGDGLLGVRLVQTGGRHPV